MQTKDRLRQRPQVDSPVDACQTATMDPEKVARARRAMRSTTDLASVAETFRMLGDPTRVAIAWALADEELCVCDLAALLGKSHSAVSHSLRALRDLRLVRYRKDGRRVCYSLDDEHITRILRGAFQHIDEIPA